MSVILSFIVPTYNSESYIKRCLDSFLIENREHKFEVIIVNDGSTDQTPELVSAYVKEYPEIFRLYNQENGGHGAAINTGVRLVKGVYFKVIDADDWIETKNLENYICELEKIDADVILTESKTFHIQTKSIGIWKTAIEDYKRGYTLEDVKKNWRSMELCLNFHGITYKTDFYKEKGINLEEHIFYEDHQYATIPCCYAKSIRIVPLVLYVYRIGDVSQSISEENQYQRHHHLETVIRCMVEYFEQHDLQGAERYYYLEKLSHLVVSYLVVMLLICKDQKIGKREAECLWNTLPQEVSRKCKKRYEVLRWMNRMHISKKMFDKILNSRIYRNLVKNT